MNGINQLDNISPMHGGNLHQVSVQYKIDIDNWIDLSTGLNPNPFPVNYIPMEVLSNLPYDNPDFIKVAADYYGPENFIALNGTQEAIQGLPELLERHPVLLPEVGYQEHIQGWHLAGSEISLYPSWDMNESIHVIDNWLENNPRGHLVIINPNNPTGLKFTPEQIHHWASKRDSGCYVIVDEAFMDLTPQDSLLCQNFNDNVIVLRSFGKFFGLAGIRLGFAFASQTVLSALKHRQGLWAVNGPAQYIAKQAFKDLAWQAQARANIQNLAQQNKVCFSGLLNKLDLIRKSESGLFSSYWLPTVQAKELYEFFCERGILLRLIKANTQTAIIRIGLLDMSNTAQLSVVCMAMDAFEKENMLEKEF
ncbi:MAG: threonine-phosphate decarboxylase [Bermanella sp.]